MCYNSMPLFFADHDVDPLILIATGLLSQEKRLQALEQRLPSTKPGAAEARLQDGEVVTRLNKLEQDVKYLRQDVEDNRLHTDHKLLVVQDRLKDLQRKESEDIRKLHKELETDVTLLEDEVNSTFSDTELDINTLDNQVDTVKSGVYNNENHYYHLRDGFFKLIDYVKAVDFAHEDVLYQIEEELKKIMKDLLAIKERHDKEDEAIKPSVGPVGETGGIQSYPVRTMSSAEKALRDWLQEDQVRHGNPSPTPPSASSNSKELPASFEELLYELKNYNM